MKFLWKVCRVAAWTSLFLLAGAPALSQSPVSLHGSVTDPSGAVIPNATVHLFNAANNSERTTTTDQRGNYSFPGVTPGTYRIHIEAQGFEPYDQQNIQVATNASLTLNIQMKIQSVQQSVTVRPQSGQQCVAPMARILPDVGPGLRTIRRGPSGNYYVLVVPGNAVAIYSHDGKRIGQVPALSPAPSPDSSLIYGADFQLDSKGRVYVADRGANAIKIYSADGVLTGKIRVLAPISVEPLAGDEVAVASLSSKNLVDIYDATNGEVDRSFGEASDPEVVVCDPGTFICTSHVNSQDVPDSDDPSDVGPHLNRSWFYGDSAGNLYLDLTFRILPTIRKYDGYGYRAYESALPVDQSFTGGNWTVRTGIPTAGLGTISSSTDGSKSSSNDSSSDSSDATTAGTGGTSPTAGQTRGGRGGGRRNGGRMELGLQLTQNAGPPGSRPVVDAIAADPSGQEIWAAVGGEIVELDKDGNLLGDYCLSAADAAAVKPVTMLVEPDRILIGYDPYGIIPYPRPDVAQPQTAPH